MEEDYTPPGMFLEGPDVLDISPVASSESQRDNSPVSGTKDTGKGKETWKCPVCSVVRTAQTGLKSHEVAEAEGELKRGHFKNAYLHAVARLQLSTNSVTRLRMEEVKRKAKEGWVKLRRAGIAGSIERAVSSPARSMSSSPRSTKQIPPPSKISQTHKGQNKDKLAIQGKTNNNAYSETGRNNNNINNMANKIDIKVPMNSQVDNGNTLTDSETIVQIYSNSQDSNNVVPIGNSGTVCNNVNAKANMQNINASGNITGRISEHNPTQLNNRTLTDVSNGHINSNDMHINSDCNESNIYKEKRQSPDAPDNANNTSWSSIKQPENTEASQTVAALKCNTLSVTINRDNTSPRCPSPGFTKNQPLSGSRETSEPRKSHDIDSNSPCINNNVSHSHTPPSAAGNALKSSPIRMSISSSSEDCNKVTTSLSSTLSYRKDSTETRVDKTPTTNKNKDKRCKGNFAEQNESTCNTMKPVNIITRIPTNSNKVPTDNTIKDNSTCRGNKIRAMKNTYRTNYSNINNVQINGKNVVVSDSDINQNVKFMFIKGPKESPDTNRDSTNGNHTSKSNPYNKIIPNVSQVETTNNNHTKFNNNGASNSRRNKYNTRYWRNEKRNNTSNHSDNRDSSNAKISDIANRSVLTNNKAPARCDWDNKTGKRTPHKPRYYKINNNNKKETEAYPNLNQKNGSAPPSNNSRNNNKDSANRSTNESKNRAYRLNSNTRHNEHKKSMNGQGTHRNQNTRRGINYSNVVSGHQKKPNSKEVCCTIHIESLGVVQSTCTWILRNGVFTVSINTNGSLMTPGCKASIIPCRDSHNPNNGNHGNKNHKNNRKLSGNNSKRYSSKVQQKGISNTTCQNRKRPNRINSKSKHKRANQISNRTPDRSKGMESRTALAAKQKNQNTNAMSKHTMADSSVSSLEDAHLSNIPNSRVRKHSNGTHKRPPPHPKSSLAEEYKSKRLPKKNTNNRANDARSESNSQNMHGENTASQPSSDQYKQNKYKFFKQLVSQTNIMSRNSGENTPNSRKDLKERPKSAQAPGYKNRGSNVNYTSSSPDLIPLLDSKDWTSRMHMIKARESETQCIPPPSPINMVPIPKQGELLRGPGGLAHPEAPNNSKRF